VLPWELWRQNFIQTASEQLAVIEIDGDHQMPLTAPGHLADALHRAAITPAP
jgi:hypothetical protein